jgi:hypothetical protein
MAPRRRSPASRLGALACAVAALMALPGARGQLSAPVASDKNVDTDGNKFLQHAADLDKEGM